MNRARPQSHQNGFSLVEMLVAITVTLIIMGSVYGLITQGQGAFGREPLLADRQQQIRIAMDRIQRDVIVGGMSLGSFSQPFAPGLDGLNNAQNPAIIGVRAAADPLLGGGNTDALEIRSMAADCPSTRLAVSNNVPGPHRAGNLLQNLDNFWSQPPHPVPQSTCFPDPGWVFLLYPDGRAKLGWLGTHALGNQNQSSFPNQQPVGSQVDGANPAADIDCSRWIGNGTNPASPNGNACALLLAAVPPPVGVVAELFNCPTCPPYAVQQAEIVRYQIGFDADGTVALFRSASGGINNTVAPPVATAPPGPQWQLVARGVEDLQVEYMSLNSQAGPGWINTPVPVLDNARGSQSTTNPGDFGNVVIGVRVTLWARAIGANPQLAGNLGDHLQGETRAAGNQVLAVRGSLISAMAPRAAQASLLQSGQWR